MQYSFEEILRCLERERAMRLKVYPRRVAANKMTQVQADREIGLLEAAIETLRRVLLLRSKQPDPERVALALQNLINQQD